MISLNIGILLKKVRLERNLTIQTVADALGISKSIISNYERNINNMPSDKLLSLLEFYHVEPLNFLVKGKEYIDISHYSEMNKQKVLAIDFEESKKLGK